MLKVVHEESESNAHIPVAVGGSLLDELVRDGPGDARGGVAGRGRRLAMIFAMSFATT
jgi:hypothetical protein